MKAHITIEVAKRSHAKVIEETLNNDAEVYAYVLIVGLLKRLPSHRARARVLTYVADHLDEHSTKVQITNGKPAA